MTENNNLGYYIRKAYDGIKKKCIPLGLTLSLLGGVSMPYLLTRESFDPFTSTLPKVNRILELQQDLDILVSRDGLEKVLSDSTLLQEAQTIAAKKDSLKSLPSYPEDLAQYNQEKMAFMEENDAKAYRMLASGIGAGLVFIAGLFTSMEGLMRRKSPIVRKYSKR